MRSLIMWNLLTLDGLFEGPKRWDLDWHGSIWGSELEQLSLEQLRSADLLVFGRHTYQGMAAYWQTAEGEAGEVADLMNQLHKAVFSRTLTSVEWNHSQLVTGDLAANILRLKGEGTGNMFLFGSSNLAAALMQQGLIDEYRLALAPVVLGGGNPLFKPQERMDLQLLEVRTLASGGVILRYKPKRNE